MKNIIWEDIPKPLNLFTVRNAVMMDLNTSKVIQYYSANTKIVVVQKTQFKNITYYRTASAKERCLDWAFEASAFGMKDHTFVAKEDVVIPLNDVSIIDATSTVSESKRSYQKRNNIVFKIKRILKHFLKNKS